MAKIKPCPTPTRRTGGAAPACTARHVVEDWCYRLTTDAATVVRAGTHEYDRDENCNRTNEQWIGDDGAVIDRCAVAVTDLLCGGSGGGGGSAPPTPPTPVSFTGEDCAGAAVTVNGTEGQLVEVVQAAGTVFTVKMCPTAGDAELVKRCDPNTGAEILFQWDVTANPPTLLSATDLTTGAAWSGDPNTLVSCGAANLESDPKLMCDSGTEFLRWYVKKDGQPTGVTFDTDLTGANYTVTNAAAVTFGSCLAATVCAPTISSAPADTLAGLLPGTSISIQKGNCCSIKVSTSVGDFIVSKDVTGYSTGDFECDVTVTGVTVLSGTCTLADIIVTTQKKA